MVFSLSLLSLSFLNVLFVWSTFDSQCCVTSGVEQCDPALHTHISIIFQIIFPFRVVT